MAEPTTGPLPERLTIGEALGPAMEIADQGEADAYFERLVTRQMTVFGRTRAEAEALERQNLGYFAGYYDTATRERVERLYRCAHPYFGAVAQNGQPSPETALNIGAAIGHGGKRA